MSDTDRIGWCAAKRLRPTTHPPTHPPCPEVHRAGDNGILGIHLSTPLSSWPKGAVPLGRITGKRKEEIRGRYQFIWSNRGI